MCTLYSGPQNEHFNYSVRSITLYKSYYTYITHFSERGVSNHGGSTEETRGCGSVSHVL